MRDEIHVTSVCSVGVRMDIGAEEGKKKIDELYNC